MVRRDLTLSAYPPSDNQLPERLEHLWSTENSCPALRPEVFRAAIAITAKGCGRDAVSPIDAAALQPENDVSTAATQARSRAGGRPATSAGAEQPNLVDGFDRDAILAQEILRRHLSFRISHRSVIRRWSFGQAMGVF